MVDKAGKKTGGRKKGTLNKNSAKLKDAIMKAFDTVGGVSYLETVAKDDPRTFCALLGKVLPSEINAHVGGDIEIVVKQYSSSDSNT